MSSVMPNALTSLITITGFRILSAQGNSNNFSQQKSLSFGLIKSGSPFFEPIQLGWEHKCRELGVTCHVRTVNDTEDCRCGCPRVAFVREFMALGVDGVAMKPCREGVDEVNAPLEEAGVPLVTFDSDIDESRRAAYVGTDQEFLGATMARLLRQLRPEGGNFAVIGRKQGRLDGFLDEITKFNDRDDRPHWYEVEKNFTVGKYEDRVNEFMAEMQGYALQNPTAIVIFYQSPMRHPNWTDFVDLHRHRNITLIGVDASDYQLDYLNRRYVDGLVSQLPFEMGSESLQVLYDIVTKGPTDQSIFPVNVAAHNLIPVELPPLELEQNLLGNLKYSGFVCFGLVSLASIACIAWTVSNRTKLVVRAAQPFFLVMVAGGVLLMCSTLVPLSYDDGGNQQSTTFNVGICMSIPWLAFTGFTVTFSALFSKTWRVKKIFHSQRGSHARVKVSVQDVLAPLIILLISNFVVLITWTVIDPLTYVRQYDIGTDFWNREFSSYGACRSENAMAYLVPLILLNFCVVTMACWQAFHARNISSEFSESTYIGLTLVSVLQSFLTGIPIIAVVREMPKAFYLVLTFMIFALCMATLLFIFFPKVQMHKKYAKMSEAEQRMAIKSSIQMSANTGASSPASGQLWSISRVSQKDSAKEPSAASPRMLASENGERMVPVQGFREENQPQEYEIAIDPPVIEVAK